MRRLRNHGSERRYYHEEVGWNCRMDAIQASVLRVELHHLDGWTQQRQGRAAKYDRLLSKAGLCTVKSDSRVKLLHTSPHAHHIFHQYVIRTARRDDLRAFLAGRNIGTEIYYPVPLHLQSCFAYMGYREGDLPESERAARDVLALPSSRN